MSHLLKECVVVLQCSVSCGAGKAERVVGCRMANGSVVEAVYCAGQERPPSIQQCLEFPCPTDPPPTPSTPQPTTEQPSTTATPSTSSAPAVAAALAGYRPQSLEIHIDPAYNSLNPVDWNPESNDVPRIAATWRTGTWSEVSRI